jgi:capsular polysaccharide export protein
MANASAPTWLGQRLIGVGFRRWKQAHLRPLLSLQPGRVVFAVDAAAAATLLPTAADALVFWGATPPPGVAALAQRSGAKLVRVEDGFVRSVGLGSDMIRPLSLVLDTQGIYFDPTQPSALEALLNTAAFGADELAEAVRVRAFIIECGITKYNHEPRGVVQWPSAGRRVVLVPGQVEDDASIRLGCTGVNTNAGLLQAARAACPGAFIVYKPHPDVASGNRKGRLSPAEAAQWADHVEPSLSVVSCIEACDELHTLTSLAGFDALLRGKRVVTHGQPFYAGWGLTEDRATGGVAWARRQRRLTLDELVAGTLLRYPIYWDWQLRGYTTCMAVLRQLASTRDALVANGGLEQLRSGWLRRQGRKAQALWAGWARP